MRLSTMPMIHPWLVITALSSALGSPLLAQSPQPIAGIFPVNTTMTANQSAPEVATDFDGAFVSVWTSDGQDGSGLGIFAQTSVPSNTYYNDLEGNEQPINSPLNFTLYLAAGLELQVMFGDLTKPKKKKKGKNKKGGKKK